MKIDKSLLKELGPEIIKNDVKSELFNKWKITSDSQMNNNQLYELQNKYKQREVLSELPVHPGIMMCSIHFPNGVGKAYELGTQIIPLVDEGEYYSVELTDDIA